MMKFIAYLSMILGGNYTCIKFTVHRENNYPIVFAAITKTDSIKVDLSNFNRFVESVYSSCDFIPISNTAYHNGFELVFGKSEQTYNSCSLFISEFFDNFNHLQCTTNLVL